MADITVSIKARTRRMWLFKSATRFTYLLERLHLRRCGLALMHCAWRFVRWEYRINGGKWESLGITVKMLARETHGNF